MAIALFLAAVHIHAQGTTDEAYVDEPLFDDFNGTEIDESTWWVATWNEHGGQTGRERCYVENGFMHMVFINSSQDGFLSAAVQTWDEYFYGKWECRLKPSNVPGVLNSMYTIDWDNTANAGSTSDGTKEEIDIEFLTVSFEENYGEVHYAVHASGRTSFNTNPDVPVDFNPSDDFHVWGFEITPEYIEWFVDDSVLTRYVYADNDIAITSPYQLKFNVWSMTEWIQGPPEPDVECIYQIDWIRFTPAGAETATDFQAGDLITSSSKQILTFHNNVISFGLSDTSPITFYLFDTSGRLVRKMYNGDLPSGNHMINLADKHVHPGIYFFSLRTNMYSVADKWVTVR
jgi:beta-glucanase (GH16 family)